MIAGGASWWGVAACTRAAGAGSDAASPVDPALRLQALRRLRFTWTPLETGAPTVDPEAPFGSSDPLADLSRVGAGMRAPKPRRLYAAVMAFLPAFVAAAAPRLRPGRYPLSAEDVARLRATAARMARFKIAFDPGLAADGGFTYTAEHAAILPRLRWIAGWRDADAPLRPESVRPERDEDAVDWPVALVDPKRPYGDMTYMESDMAEALGIPVGVDAQGHASLPPQVEARLTALHHTTVAALRVLVLNG